jgi:geranylgeranyl diphosphate synthase type I
MLGSKIRCSGVPDVFVSGVYMQLPDVFHRYRGEIVEELSSIIDGSSLALYDMMRYHLGWVDEQGNPKDANRRAEEGGKLVRPTLVLLCCEAVGGDWHMALPAAAAVELVHDFSLIHDDIEDGDEERRQCATVWCLWGEPQAINVGDAMHSLARLALWRLDGHEVSPHKVRRAARILDETCLELCEGQYLDICYESRFDINVDDYLEMIDRKTAALISCSITLGALIGTDDENTVSQFERFGRKLGLAYQMVDDVLGIWGGKSASDIQKKKKTLPVIYALERAGGKDRSTLSDIYAKEVLDSGDIERVICILDNLGAEGYTRGVAAEYYNQALREIGGVDLIPPARDELKEFTAFLMVRES